MLLELAVGEPGRTALTARITRLAAEYPAGFGGVLSLLALDEEALPPFGSLSGGLAGSLGLIQALGDAGMAAPLWALTRGAVATAPDEPLDQPDAGPGLGAGPGSGA